MIEEKEIWKSITGYEGLYEISNFGNIKALAKTRITSTGVIKNYKEKVLKPTRSGEVRNDGSYYLKIGLTNDLKEIKQFHIHALVALIFIPNPNNYSEINHIDENKHNNSMYNLEWCTRKQNNEHSNITTNLNNAKKVKVNQLTLSGEFIRSWDGIREASRGIGASTHKHINDCCSGKAKTASGYKWCYGE